MKHLVLFSVLFFHSQVGFFPSECVELISEKIPSNVTNSLTKPGTRFFILVNIVEL